ncbi:NAD(P)H-binding protein [Pseudovibrio sp. SPO723]|uniref:NAD(P)H-binding protein n=1 Tax=Nesiotobacter zosterae TaxID=392721 RepID=UPI0029C47D28|nr:NAD(P)H-binding protein [Pseudovibrio sp. SPO723]MDX5592958.1 NAD(P)H-binding protein [Pseudovibrio sp. SPO723]
MTEKTAIVFGASGLIGSNLVRHLLANESYHKVTVLVRRSLGIEHAKLDEHLVDFANTNALNTLIRGDDAFSCLGTTHKKAGSREAFQAVDFTLVHTLAQIARGNGVTHLLLVSSLGANPGSRSAYLRTKGEVEQAVADLGFPRTSIFRPSLLIGERNEYRLKESLAAAILSPLGLFLLGPLKRYRPIAAEQVAKAMIEVAAHPAEGLAIYQNEEIAAL